ncbi:MAG: phage portal protein [Ramlibacter sp.]|nr:phage portal protein [Ramlibacter sp.]
MLRGGGSGDAQMSSGAHQGASRDDTAMMGWDPQSGSADADLLPDLETLTARSRDLTRNNGLMSGAVQTYRDNIVGSVLRLSAMPDYKLLGWTREQAHEWGNSTEPKFRSWAETTECDAGRTLNLIGLTTQALGGAFMNGDAVGLPMWIPTPGHRWNTKIMMVEADRLATPTELAYRNNLRGGIEFDQYGAPQAYHILKNHPGDGLAGLLGLSESWGLMDYERIPAFTPWGRRRVIHLHDKERAGQSRGRPIVSAVMREFHMAGKYSGNELESSVAGSLVAAFLESNMDAESANELFGKDPREAWATSVKQAQNIRKLKGAAIIPIPAGAKLQGFAPNRPNAAFEAFMLAVLRHIAAGMNMPYELLLKDFSKSNYSSARAALLEAWRFFNGRRRWLTDYWLKPIYELWLEEAVNAGEVDAPDFYANRYAYTRCRFIFGGRGWVDPVKEATAAALRIDTGLSTLEQECAEQGLDYEEVLDQQQLEARMRSERGLTSARDAATNAASVPVPPEQPADTNEDTQTQEDAVPA